jgi:PmbA protein
VTAELLVGRGEDVLLGRAEAAVRSLGGPGDAFVTSRSGGYTRFAGSRVHQPQAIDEVQLMVRSVTDRGSARVATSLLPAAEWAGREAARLASQLPRRFGPAVELPGADQETKEAMPTWHDESMRFDAAERGRLAGLAIAKAQRLGASAHGMLSLAVVELAVANSQGKHRYMRATEVYYSLLFRLGQGSGYRSDLSRDLRRLDPERAMEEALGDCVASQDPDALAPGAYDVVLGPLAVGDALGFFGAMGFTGDAVLQGAGAVARRRGAMVADRRISVFDDALGDFGLPIPFDLEGVSKRTVPMLDRGVVAEAVTDLATAARLQQASSGHAHIGREQPPAPTPANLVLKAGDESTETLIAGVERGLLVSRFHYTRMIDPESTAFTGVTRDATFRIADGRVAGPVTNSRFSEEVLSLLARCDGVGDTLVSQPLMNIWNGAASAPALRIRGFQLGFR